MEKKKRLINEDFLEKLANVAAPTGSEQPVQRIYRDYLKDIADSIETDMMGNVKAILNPEKKPKIIFTCVKSLTTVCISDKITSHYDSIVWSLLWL